MVGPPPVLARAAAYGIHEPDRNGLQVAENSPGVPFEQRCRIKWIDASSNITRADARRLRLITWIDFQSVYFDDDVDRDVALALFG